MLNDEQAQAINSSDQIEAAAGIPATPGDSAETNGGNGLAAEALSETASPVDSSNHHDNGAKDADTVEADLSKKERFDFRRRALLKELESKEKEIDKLRDDNLKVTLQYAELKDRHLRMAAEMENSRKRLEREFASRAESKVAELLGELLPVVDDLERFFDSRKPEASGEPKDDDALTAGARLIYQNVLKILQSRGVSAMETLGRQFDPNRHEALLQMQVEGQAPNLVVQETTKGYLLFDKVLRPAKVIVSA
jgi:molecular chaperone GrpE